MKKLIIILTVVIISLNLSAQSKDSIPKVDSSLVPILSISDINNFLYNLQDKISYSRFQFLFTMMQDLIHSKEQELQQPKKK